MATINKQKSARTHEGAKGRAFAPEQELRRALMSCMLWEDQFYEDSVAIAERIGALVPKTRAETVAALAIQAREDMKLRHAPLLVVREMARHEGHKALVADTLERIVQRPDELTEFLAIYWADALGPMQQRKTRAVSAQAKKGLARAFAPRRGFALRDAIVSSQPHYGTELGKAVAEVDRKDTRLIVFTDEQAHDPVGAPKGLGYMVNVASYKHGVGHGDWRRIDGFSEKILDWIITTEEG